MPYLSQHFSFGMLKNYFKVSIRSILKYKIFSAINIFGLAIAMSVCMLLILMLADQKSYDQFQQKRDHIYRILTLRKGSVKPNASTPFPLASALKADYPIIEEATHLFMGVGGDLTYNNNSMEARGYFADPTFFDVFSFKLDRGDKTTALSAPHSMIITGELALRLFGDENPIGKTVRLFDRGLYIMQLDFSAMDSPPVDWGSYTITGVLSNNCRKSHLKFDALISASSLQTQPLYEKKDFERVRDNWREYSKCYSYVVLKSTNDEHDLTLALNDLATRKYSDIEDLQGFRLIGQKLTEITPGEFVGNPPSLRLPIQIYYFLGSLALIIIILACLNYTNLSIARALTRAKEIGVRKVAGAKRKNLVFQFLSESTVTALIALFMALALLTFVKSGFVNLWLNRYLNFDLHESLRIYLIFAGFAVLVGLLAGVFPALNLSRYQPIKVLRDPENVRPGKLRLRKILGVSQFVVSLFFIVTAILIYNQVRHLLGFEYGFNSKNIVNIELQGNDFQLLASELNSVSGVSRISACAFIPATGMYNGTSLKSLNGDESAALDYLAADANFVDNLELEIVAGRNFPATGENSNRLILINETAARKLGYEDATQICGQAFLMHGNPDDEVEVIGVMKDFHFQSAMLEDKIGAFMLRNQSSKFSYVNVKIVAGKLEDTISRLREKWQSLDSVHPFKYHLFDEQVAAVNQALGDVLSILGFIAFLAVTIACLGLLGMAMYTTERRRKEIGIRKILGAAEAGLALLLSKEFLRMLLISILIAAPLSYFANNVWLRNFPNRVEFGLGPIFWGSMVLLVLGLITIGSQTLRATRSNPVESLRTE